MMEAEFSPCKTCTRVKHPENCENKHCKAWQAWFRSSWEKTRNNPRLQREKKSPQLEGVNIGGREYILPHRIREYVQDSPCSTCPLWETVCTSPCPAYRTWTEIRKEVSL